MGKPSRLPNMLQKHLPLLLFFGIIQRVRRHDLVDQSGGNPSPRPPAIACGIIRTISSSV